MSRGKYLSLEEARKDPKLWRQFIREHPSEADRERFNKLLDAMAKPQSSSEAEET